MKPLSARLVFMLTAVMLLSEYQARADTIPIGPNFDYTWSVTSGNTTPNVISGSPLNSGSVQIATRSDVQQPFTLSTPAAPNNVVTIPVADVFTSGGPSTFGTGAGATPFNLLLVLTEHDANKSYTSQPLVFAGTLSGTLATDPKQTTLTLDLPANAESVTVGNNIYQVKINQPEVFPGRASGPPFISADVVVTSAQPNPTSNNTPEPSSLVLAASAMLGLAARRWKRSFRREN